MYRQISEKTLIRRGFRRKSSDGPYDGRVAKANSTPPDAAEQNNSGSSAHAQPSSGAGRFVREEASPAAHSPPGTDGAAAVDTPSLPADTRPAADAEPDEQERPELLDRLERQATETARLTARIEELEQLVEAEKERGKALAAAVKEQKESRAEIEDKLKAARREARRRAGVDRDLKQATAMLETLRLEVDRAWAQAGAARHAAAVARRSPIDRLLRRRHGV